MSVSPGVDGVHSDGTQAHQMILASRSGEIFFGDSSVFNVNRNNGTLASFRHSGESRNPESLVGNLLDSGFRRNDDSQPKRICCAA
jgi:hypothetical protein